MCSRTTNKDLCNLSKDCQWNSTGCVETIKKEHWINYINNATKAQAKIRLANSVRRKKKLAEPNNNFKTAINNRPISPKLSSIDIETVKRQTVKLLSEIQINYDRLGKEGDIIKAAELSRKRVDKMSLQVSDIKDILAGKAVYVVPPPYYNKVILLDLRSKLFVKPGVLAKGLGYGAEIKTLFSIIKNTKVVTTADYGRRWLPRALNREAGDDDKKTEQLIWWKIGPELIDYLEQFNQYLEERILLSKFL
jgi:hypothetical protein